MTLTDTPARTRMSHAVARKLEKILASDRRRAKATKDGGRTTEQVEAAWDLVQYRRADEVLIEVDPRSKKDTDAARWLAERLSGGPWMEHRESLERVARELQEVTGE